MTDHAFGRMAPGALCVLLGTERVAARTGGCSCCTAGLGSCMGSGSALQRAAFAASCISA